MIELASGRDKFNPPYDATKITHTLLEIKEAPLGDLQKLSSAFLMFPL